MPFVLDCPDSTLLPKAMLSDCMSITHTLKRAVGCAEGSVDKAGGGAQAVA